MELAPRPGGNIIVHFLDDGAMIVETGDHQPPVDIVVCLLVDPVLFNVLPDKGAVGGAFGRLDEAEVCADDLGVWVLAGELDGPDSGAGAYIEYVFWVLDGC